MEKQSRTKKDIVKMLLKNKELENEDEEQLMEILFNEPIAIDVDKQAEESETWSDKLADKITEVAGSWSFIIIFVIILISWMSINYLLAVNAFDPYQLMHLYNLLFPNDPLPPDMYTTDHIKRIIIGRVSEQMPKTSFDNIFFTDDYLKMLERYEQEEIDFSQDDEY